MKTEPLYKTEADLCADFMAWVKDAPQRYGPWTPYAETAGWDILLVNDAGTQIGIQAKLKLNQKVIEQSLPGWVGPRQIGPDFRAVLVPEWGVASPSICASLGLSVIHRFSRSRVTFSEINLEDYAAWHPWHPDARCRLPAYVPDVPAGVSGPVRLTPWKVGALRVLATIETRGFVTRADFSRLRIDPRPWTGPHGWVVPGAVPGQFIRGEVEFDRQHPQVYAQVLAEVAEYERKEGDLFA